MTDLDYMSRALQLARESIGLSSPNPQVGCVLVRDSVVLGEGAHIYEHYDHAEIVALKDAHARGHEVSGATAYVTLEPCSHHGRTGPCADALIAAGIARCVVATGDPNPEVSGRGIAKLQAAGIEVLVGPLGAEAQAINDAFAWSITEGRPWVRLKAALSVDGYLAPTPERRIANEPFWLTGAEARQEVQRLRHASDAILTGVGTVLADDPLLTDRTGLPRRRPLMRVVMDSRLRTPVGGKLVQSFQQNAAEDLWIFCGSEASAERETVLVGLGVKVTRVPEDVAGGLNLRAVLRQLHQARLLSVLVEAGSTINEAFLRDDLVDEVTLFFAETELGAGSLPFATGTDGPFALEQRLLDVSKKSFGADVCVAGRLHDPWRKPGRLG